MCSVSMIGDHYREKWIGPQIQPQILPTPPTPSTIPFTYFHPPVHREEFERLKREVLEMKELLKRAVKYDEDNGQLHCEQDEKIAILKKVAEMVGVSLDDVLK